MTTLSEVMVARMNAQAGLTALIGAGSAARLFPFRIPLNAALPAVAYQVIDSPLKKSHTGSSHLARSRVQFTCHGETLLQAEAVAAQIATCWDGVRGNFLGLRLDGAFPESARQEYSETHEAAVVRLDVIFWHEVQ